jgi:hypothetical protein
VRTDISSARQQVEPVRVLHERLAVNAVAALPQPPTEVGRSSNGVLYFKWESPCPDIEALWVSISSREVTLSCRISHTHFSVTSYRPRLTWRKLKYRIVQDGFNEAARFLDGEVATTISYDGEGKPHSYGWAERKRLAESLEYLREVFGPEMTQRAWDWNGEVNADA